MLLRKRHNNFFVFGFSSFVVILAWYRTLLARHFSFSVMRINHDFHVGHATVTYFNVVFIEQLVKFVVSREVLINQF